VWKLARLKWITVSKNLLETRVEETLIGRNLLHEKMEKKRWILAFSPVRDFFMLRVSQKALMSKMEIKQENDIYQESKNANESNDK